MILSTELGDRKKMSKIEIWGRYKSHRPEKIDTAKNEDEAAYLLYEYKLAYGALPGQINHGFWKLWTGLRKDEPT